MEVPGVKLELKEKKKKKKKKREQQRTEGEEEIVGVNEDRIDCGQCRLGRRKQAGEHEQTEKNDDFDDYVSIHAGKHLFFK